MPKNKSTETVKSKKVLGDSSTISSTDQSISSLAKNSKLIDPDASKSTDHDQDSSVSNSNPLDLLSNAAGSHDFGKSVSAPVIHAPTKDKESDEKPPTKLLTKPFGSEDFEKLCEDEYCRFWFPSMQVGHAFVYTDDNGKSHALQYKAPNTTQDLTPKVVELKDIRIKHHRFGKRPKAVAPDGTVMVSMRSIELEAHTAEGVKKGQLMFFSPKQSYRWQRKDPNTGKQISSTFWGSNKYKLPDMFDPSVSESKKQAILQAHAKGTGFKEGSKKLDPNALAYKDANKKRLKDQKAVMDNTSARDECKKFYDEMNGVLSKQFNDVLKAGIGTGDWSIDKKNSRRQEWLHLMAHNFYGVDEDPQIKENLSAAPKWLNTEMMTIEKALKWHGLNDQRVETSAAGRFNELLGKPIMHDGWYKGFVAHKDTKNAVQMHQYLNPWQKFAPKPKTTDLAQTTLVTHAILHNHEAKASTVLHPPESVHFYSTRKNALTRASSTMDTHSISQPVSAAQTAQSQAVTGTNLVAAATTMYSFNANSMTQVADGFVFELVDGSVFKIKVGLQLGLPKPAQVKPKVTEFDEIGGINIEDTDNELESDDEDDELSDDFIVDDDEIDYEEEKPRKSEKRKQDNRDKTKHSKKSKTESDDDESITAAPKRRRLRRAVVESDSDDDSLDTHLSSVAGDAVMDTHLTSADESSDDELSDNEAEAPTSLEAFEEKAKRDILAMKQMVDADPDNVALKKQFNEFRKTIKQELDSRRKLEALRPGAKNFIEAHMLNVADKLESKAHESAKSAGIELDMSVYDPAKDALIFSRQAKKGGRSASARSQQHSRQSSRSGVEDAQTMGVSHKAISKKRRA